MRLSGSTNGPPMERVWAPLTLSALQLAMCRELRLSHTSRLSSIFSRPGRPSPSLKTQGLRLPQPRLLHSPNSLQHWQMAQGDLRPRSTAKGARSLRSPGSSTCKDLLLMEPLSRSLALLLKVVVAVRVEDSSIPQRLRNYFQLPLQCNNAIARIFPSYCWFTIWTLWTLKSILEYMWIYLSVFVKYKLFQLISVMS